MTESPPKYEYVVPSAAQTPGPVFRAGKKQVSPTVVTSRKLTDADYRDFPFARELELDTAAELSDGSVRFTKSVPDTIRPMHYSIYGKGEKPQHKETAHE